jgi:hypothetical protein
VVLPEFVLQDTDIYKFVRTSSRQLLVDKRTVCRTAFTAEDPTLPYSNPYCCRTVLQGTHHMYEQPQEFRPERYMPGGEYDQFDDAIRAYMFLPFIQVCMAEPSKHPYVHSC